jgi:hypothetical protein
LQGQPTADLAHFCATLRGDGLPSTASERVRYLLLDHLAAAGFVGPTAILEKRASYNRHNRCKASIKRL